MSTTYRSFPNWRSDLSVEEDFASAYGAPTSASFLVEVRNRAMSTGELAERIGILMSEGGFDVTVTPSPPSNNPVEQSVSATSAASKHALERGETRLLNWTLDGTLVAGAEVETAWGVKRQTVDAARERGEIFSLWVKGRHWYPAEALKFERPVLAAICIAFGDINPSSKLLFLLRKHGALGGLTPVQAVISGLLQDVVRLAASWGRS